MNTENNDQHKIDKLERKLKESNDVSNAIFSIFAAILISVLSGGMHPLVIGILFFVIYGILKLIR